MSIGNGPVVYRGRLLFPAVCCGLEASFWSRHCGSYSVLCSGDVSRSMCAPTLRNFSSMRSYPRSMW